MNPSEIQSWIGIAGVLFGAGIAYQALKSRIKSLEERASKIESTQSEFEKESNKKLDLVLVSINDMKTGMARIEERIHKSL